MSSSDPGFQIAVEEAKTGLAEGGHPIGGCVVSKDGEILGRGRNMRKQNGSHILHGETAAFENAKHLERPAFEGSTVYTTLSPCPMCAGAMIWFKIARLVIGDNVNMNGREELLRSHGIEVIETNDKECEDLYETYENGQKSLT